MNYVNGIKKSKLVTFPRSGLTLMVRGLQTLLPRELVYSEYYMVEHKMDNCEFVNLESRYDFKLDLEYEPEKYNYIILYREPEGAIRSWFRQSNGDNYEEFYAEKKEYYDAWMEKWSEVGYTVTYEELTSNMMTTLVNIVKNLSDIDIKDRIPALSNWIMGERRVNRFRNLVS